MPERIAERLSPTDSLPAVGQGALGLECRAGDEAVLALIEPLSHAETQVCVRSERAFNHRLMGGCQVPIAGYAVLEGDQLWLRGRVGRVDGQALLKDELRGDVTDAEGLGVALAERLLAAGADQLLAMLD